MNTDINKEILTDINKEILKTLRMINLQVANIVEIQENVYCRLGQIVEMLEVKEVVKKRGRQIFRK